MPANEVTQLINNTGAVQQRPVVGGYVAPGRPAPASFTDQLWVVLPEYGLNALFGPCEWGAIHGGSLPAAGTQVAVVFDDRNVPVVVWWEGVFTEAGILTTVEYNSSPHTLLVTDAGKVLNCNTAGAFTLTVPKHAKEPIPVGAVVEVRQWSAGTVTVTPEAGVTLRTAASLETRKQYSLIGLHQTVLDEWAVAGDLK